MFNQTQSLSYPRSSYAGYTVFVLLRLLTWYAFKLSLLNIVFLEF